MKLELTYMFVISPEFDYEEQKKQAIQSARSFIGQKIWDVCDVTVDACWFEYSNEFQKNDHYAPHPDYDIDKQIKKQLDQYMKHDGFFSFFIENLRKYSIEKTDKSRSEYMFGIHRNEKLAKAKFEFQIIGFEDPKGAFKYESDLITSEIPILKSKSKVRI